MQSRHKKNDTNSGASQINRRTLLKGSGLAAIAGTIGFKNAEAAPAMRVAPTTYELLGVEPVINCWGTMTVLGGSLMEPEVIKAMECANSAFVSMPDLIEGAGRRLAELTGAPWGCVTGGAASAIFAATVAVVCGEDEEKKAKIPDTTGMKSEAIMPKAHFLGYHDAACRMVGLKLKLVDSRAELEAAVSDKTAIIYLVGEDCKPGFPSRGNLAYKDIIDVAKKNKIPAFVDAAAEEPGNPDYYLENGADLVCYSGGKCLRGPQSAGILIGREDLCRAAARSLSPFEGIGRTQKVGKEEIMGVLTALDLWFHGRDHKAEFKEWERILAFISERISRVPSVKTVVVQPGRPSNVAPTMSIDWDQKRVKLTHADFQKQLYEGYPRIKVATYTGDSAHSQISSIMPYQMRPGDEIVVARRMYEILAQAAK